MDKSKKVDFFNMTREEEVEWLDAKYAMQNEMMALQYDKFDINLKDIDEQMLETLGYGTRFPGHLTDSEFPTPSFPATGKITEGDLRPMIPLSFKNLDNPDSKTLNVWCIVDTSCRFTCLSVKTLEAFMGTGNVLANNYKKYQFAIQDPSSKIECYVSKVGSNFEHANILGMNALKEPGLSVAMNWAVEEFRLVKYSPDMYMMW